MANEHVDLSIDENEMTGRLPITSQFDRIFAMPEGHTKHATFPVVSQQALEIVGSAFTDTSNGEHQRMPLSQVALVQVGRDSLDTSDARHTAGINSMDDSKSDEKPGVRKPRRWLARGDVMLYDLQHSRRHVDSGGLLRSVSFVSTAKKQSMRQKSPVKSTQFAGTDTAACKPEAPRISAPQERSLISAAAAAMLQIDAIQSEQLARSLRMRTEAASLTRSVPQLRGDLHAAGFGQSKLCVRGPMDTVASSLMKSMVSTVSAIKDARILPMLRRDFARAISLITDNDGAIVAAEAYLARMLTALRLLREIRESLHGVLSECLASLVETIAAVAKTAAATPEDIVPEAYAKSPAGRTTSRELIETVFNSFQATVWKKLLHAVNKESGEAMRLEIRCRTFIAQVENRLAHLQETAFFDKASVFHGAAGRTVGDAMSHLSASEDHAGAVGSRRQSTATNAVSHTGTGHPDENAIAVCIKQLAQEDACLVQGSFVRVCRIKAAAVVDAEKDALVAETMIAVPDFGGVRATSSKLSGVTALSPASPLLLATSAPTLPKSGRDPVYDPAKPGIPADIPVETDAVEFIQYLDCFSALLATPIRAPPAVSEEDALSGEPSHAKDMLSAVVLENNVDKTTAEDVTHHNLCIVWRHALIRYGFEVRKRAADGVRDLWTTLVIPPKRKRVTADDIRDISVGTEDRVLLDTHLADTLYRMLEAAAIAHVFPMA